MSRRNSPSPAQGLNFAGSQLRRLRKKAGLKQSELVARLQVRGWSDLNEPVVSMIEHGRRGLSDWELKLLLEAIGARWRDLE